MYKVDRGLFMEIDNTDWAGGSSDLRVEGNLFMLFCDDAEETSYVSADKRFR
jgi:hypothetical protein